MILVDMNVPSVNNVYDFNLDENTTIDLLIEEVSELIEQKEQCHLIGDRKALMLCDMKTKQVLPVNYTLTECGIQTGDSLLLV